MIIYKVKNKISGKVYIGQTIHTLETRQNAHLKMVEVGKSKFYKALKSYGVDNFDWDVIDTATTKDELNQNEKSITPFKDYLDYNGTYEEAELECLKKLIEIVNTKEK